MKLARSSHRKTPRRSPFDQNRRSRWLVLHLYGLWRLRHKWRHELVPGHWDQKGRTIHLLQPQLVIRRVEGKTL